MSLSLLRRRLHRPAAATLTRLSPWPQPFTPVSQPCAARHGLLAAALTHTQQLRPYSIYSKQWIQPRRAWRPTHSLLQPLTASQAATSLRANGASLLPRPGQKRHYQHTNTNDAAPAHQQPIIAPSPYTVQLPGQHTTQQPHSTAHTAAQPWLTSPIAQSVLPSPLERLKRVGTELGILAVSFGIAQVTVLAFYRSAVAGVPSLAQADVMQANLIAVNATLMLTIGSYIYIARWVDRRFPLAESAVPTQTRSGVLHIVGVALACIAAQIVISIVINTFVANQTKEEPMVIEMIMTANPFVLVTPMIIGPVNEELIFRCLLFARLLRSCGAGVAYTVSSALFGLAHVSEESNKVLECTFAGLVMAASYHLTRTLWAPLLVHTLNNSIIAVMYVGISPTWSDDVRERCMGVFWKASHDGLTATVAVQRFLRAVPLVRNLLPKSPLVTVAGQPTELLDRLVDNVFDILDHQQRGYLGINELAFLITLDESSLSVLVPAWKITQQQASKTDTKTIAGADLPNNELVRSDSVSKSPKVLMMELSDASDVDIGERLDDIKHFDAAFAREPRYSLQTHRRAIRLFAEYIQQFTTAFARSEFGSDQCSREQFQQYVQRTALVSPQETQQTLFHLLAIAAHRAQHPMHSLSKAIDR